MPARSTDRRAAKDRAYEHVKTQIMTGAYPGGELISEGEVAAAIGMSRTPVREGFLRLEAEGLLRLFPQRGALVVPVSPDEVRAVMEARLVLERFAVEKAVGLNERARAELAERLTEFITSQRQAIRTASTGEMLEADRAFHTALLDAAGNSFLLALYTSLRDRQVRMIGESAARDDRRLGAILAEHTSIVDAVRSGDASAAAEAVGVHLDGTAAALGLPRVLGESAATLGG